MTENGHVVALYLSRRDCWRGPVPTKRQFIGKAIELATGSELVHVAVACDGAVLDPGLVGDRLYAEAVYALISHWTVKVDVTTPRRPDLDQGYDPRPRTIIPTIIRWASLGLVPARDCVSVCARHLRAAGLRIRNDVTSPHELALYLLENYGAHATCRYPD